VHNVCRIVFSAAIIAITANAVAPAVAAVKCPVSPKAPWKDVHECLKDRERTLFAPPAEPVSPGRTKTTGAFTADVESLDFVPEAPRALPPSLDDRLEQSKAQTLRRFEAEQNLEFQQEFRDFLEAR
jgi:hypothetical protein